MLEGRLALLQFASATFFFFLLHLFQVPFNVLLLVLLGSVEPQLFKLTSYLPTALFLLLCSPVMSQPSQNHEEINDSLQTGPRPLHSLSSLPAPPHMPACNPLLLAFSLLSSPRPIQKDPNTSLSIRAYYRVPVLVQQRKKAFGAQECVQEIL